MRKISNCLGLTLLGSLFGFAACGEKDATQVSYSSFDQIRDTMESGLTVTGGALDDASNEDLLENLMSPTSACSRTFSSCTDSTLSRTMSCTVGRYGWSGEFELAFKDASDNALGGCLSNFVATSGAYFVRQANFVRTAPRGKLTTTTDIDEALANYEGTVVAGGTKVTRTASGYEIDVLGVSKILRNRAGAKVFDMSVKSESPLVVNQMPRDGRVVNSGSVAVYHNIVKFKAVHAYSGLTWEEGCCHPVSGSITTTLSGTIEGTATATFDGCGSGTVEWDGSTRAFELGNCE